MDKSAKIYVAGHRGMVGSAIIRELNKKGFRNIIKKTRGELDLLNQQAVAEFFVQAKPDYVVLAAAKVGGIFANNEYPADFIYENLMVQTNVIHQAYKTQVKQLLFLGSSCIYPKLAEQPMQESALLTGELEPTNEPYAIAKIAGIKLCESYNRQYGTDFRAVMPTNLYGPNDNYDLQNSHVIPGLIRRIHQAKTNNDKALKIWGTGSAMREFLYVDDLAEACVMLMSLGKMEYKQSLPARNSQVNIGTGSDISINELVAILVDIIGYKGKIKWDTSKPDGTPRKLLDVSRMTSLGWNASTTLIDGLRLTYRRYLETR
ncbi:GDP-L-fucose synthase family protein [Cycloclasticus zancles]|uniref:GDP-L-fucose synthase n=1 Tax=Cycloclasticus zancles 78-ME TaxID=1198232 RepID=S5TZW6_9GAMM|nr:GDP-L-fucose synthase [Cycloclasticus zancles]AGS40568.1 GDP-L-fucose synthase [Cycloclasticus zancles 78-ME]